MTPRRLPHLPRGCDSGNTPEPQVRREMGRGDGCPRVGLLGPPRRPAQANGLPGRSAHEALTPPRLQEAPSRLPQPPGPQASPPGDHIPPASPVIMGRPPHLISVSDPPPLPLRRRPVASPSGGTSTLNPGRSHLQALNRICHVRKVRSTGTRGQDADTPSLGQHSTNCTAIPRSGGGELWSGQGPNSSLFQDFSKRAPKPTRIHCVRSGGLRTPTSSPVALWVSCCSSLFLVGSLETGPQPRGPSQSHLVT